MPLERKVILELLQEAFPGAEVVLVDSAGDQDHYELSIKHSSFRGFSKLQQHRMVYQALGSCVGTQLHAISITTSF